MSHTIVESGASFPGTLTMPDNTEVADAAFLELLLQSLGNRALWLKALCTVGGIPRLAYIANIAALQAIDVSTVQTTDVRLVYGTGLYLYDSGSSATQVLPWIVQPSVGAGRWIHLLANYAPTNRIVDMQSVYEIANYSNATTSYTTVIALNHAAAVAGDVLLIDWSAAYTAVGASGSNSRITITDGGVDTDLAPTLRLHSAAREHHGGQHKYVVANTGIVYVTLKAASIVSGTTTTDSAGTGTVRNSLRSVLHRP